MTRKSFVITLTVIVAVMVGLFFLNRAEDRLQTWDSEYPMVNTNVSWQQTFYDGAWSGA